MSTFLSLSGISKRFGSFTALDAVDLQIDPGLATPPGGLWLAWQGSLHRVPAGQARLILPAAAPAR